MILIGSRALFLRAKSIFNRKISDFDFICHKYEFDSWLDKNINKIKNHKIYELKEFNKWIVEGDSIFEFDIIQPNSSSELFYNLVKNDNSTIFNDKFGTIPSLNALFALKDSHKYKKFNSIKGFSYFYKHAYDWHLMKNIGAEIETQYKEFTLLREKETYNYKLPKLNVSKNDFFNEDLTNVKQLYIHDDIHKAIALYGKPAYEYYLSDDSEVLTSKRKFFECSEDIRLAGVIEEAMTLALERSKFDINPSNSEFYFKFALAKVCTTICGGYFREYAYYNLYNVLEKYPKNYFEIFNNAVKNGTVRVKV